MPERERWDVWLAASVLVFLAAAEMTVRWALESRSYDARHIREIPRIAEELGRAKGIRILFLGNSLTRAGVDAQAFDNSLRALRGVAVESGRVYPDDTKIGEWYYTFKHYFVRTRRLPQLLVIGFVGRQVEDFGSLAPARLATAYGGFSNTAEFFRDEIHDFGGRVEFVLAGFSAAFAYRENVKNAVLEALIPHYQSTAARMNRALRRTAGEQSARPTYHRLERMLNLAQQSRVHVILVALPQPAPYPVDEVIAARLRESGMTYLDCRTVEGLRDEDFPDGYHLGPQGAKIFSRDLARRMAGELSAISGQLSALQADR